MITSPTLLVDQKQCLSNINRMAGKAKKHGLKFKPHFKTHQSPEIGRWFKSAGINAITVSSVQMGHIFANHGWNDITIAFPVNIRAIDRINELADKISTLSLLIADDSSAQFLSDQLNTNVEIYIEIDTGGKRSGFFPDDTESIRRLIKLLKSSDKMTLQGFYSHPGHSYSARSKQELLGVHSDVITKMQTLKEQFGDLTCCIGDTPCCSVAGEFDGIDEISPGNFVFYDLMQVQIGSCTFDDIAVALAAPVVAKYPSRQEVIIHGGAVHLSKESLEWNGNQIYGLPVILNDHSWDVPTQHSYLKTISQEHGVLKCSNELFSVLEIGDLIGILPIHSCLTANLMKPYHLLEGNDLIN